MEGDWHTTLIMTGFHGENPKQVPYLIGVALTYEWGLM